MSNIKLQHNREESYTPKHINNTEKPIKCRNVNKDQVGKDLTLIFRNSFNKFSQITNHKPTVLEMSINHVNDTVREMGIMVNIVIDLEELVITVI